MDAKRVRLMLVLFAATAVAACGGGGGGSSNPVPTVGSGGTQPTPTPTAGPTTAAQSAVAQSRNVANSALNLAGTSLDINQFNPGGNGAGIFALRRAIAWHRDDGGAGPAPSPSGSPACDNGVEFTQTPASGGVTETIEYFYDDACTQPRKLDTLSITFTTNGGSSTGSETLWDDNGNIVDYKTVSASFTLDGSGNLASVSVEKTAAVSPSAAPFKQTGFTCLYGTGDPVDCGNAAVATIAAPKIDPNDDDGDDPTPAPSGSPAPSASPAASPTPFEVGFAGTVLGTLVTPSPSSSPTPVPSASPDLAADWKGHDAQLQLTISGTGYAGATGSMTIAPATAPAWSISGGTQVSTLSGTLALGCHADDSLGTSSLTLTDSADGYTIALTSNGNHRLSGNVTNASNQTIATVNVDDSGNGVINYTTGATGKIRDWVVLD
jgi:hypothetical protein